MTTVTKIDRIIVKIISVVYSTVTSLLTLSACKIKSTFEEGALYLEFKCPLTSVYFDLIMCSSWSKLLSVYT